MADLGTWLRELFGNKGDENADSPMAPAGSHAGEPPSFAEGNNQFALAMYGLLRQTPGNLFFSPFSIRTALAMTQTGAAGETAAQMREALRLSSSDETPHLGFAEIIQRLNNTGAGEYEMSVANSLWGQQGAPLQPGFLDLTVRHYGGGMNVVDFRRDAEAGRVAMNRWVEEKTRQKIRELISRGSLDDDTRLILINAVYFKGMWALPFSRETTLDAPFHLEDGRKVQVPLMLQQPVVKYLRASDYQAVGLAYRGGELSMLLLLPDRGDGLRDLERRLSTQMLHDCFAQMHLHEVMLFLPRFRITWGAFDLRDQLAALGMPLAFSSSRADFSGINGHKPPDEEALFLSAVFHKAFVEVHEEGTEAAAATAVLVAAGSALWPSAPPPVPIFRADHPFLFAIRDRESGAILFLGRVTDPAQENG